MFALVIYVSPNYSLPPPDDFNFARKKKHPELAYRSHEFFDMSLALTSDSPDFAGERVRRLSPFKTFKDVIIIVRDYLGAH